MRNKDMLGRTSTMALVYVFLLCTTCFSNVLAVAAQDQSLLTTTTAGAASVTSAASALSNSGSSSSTTLHNFANNNDDYDSSKEDEESQRRKLVTETSMSHDDFTFINNGGCTTKSNDYYERFTSYAETSTLNHADCIGACGNGITGISVRGSQYNRRCTGFIAFGTCIFGGWVDEYRLRCYCYEDDAVTGADGTSGTSCYSYNKNDQLIGTGYENSFFFAGQGRCIGTVNGQVFGSNSHSDKKTDNDCAQQCSSSLAFSRKLDDNTCYCHTDTTGTGDVKASSNDDYNCYSKMNNRIDGTSGFVYDGWGEYPTTGPGREHVGVVDTDAECAKTCLDKYIAGDFTSEVEGITKNKQTGDCYCTFGTLLRQNNNQKFTSYYLLPSARVFDCPANSVLSTTLYDGKTRLESACDCTGGGKTSLSILDSETCDCPAITNSWCSDAESDRYELTFDCDSDGNLESLCVSQNGYTMLKSQNACSEVAGTSVVNDCPVAGYGNQDLGTRSSEYYWTGIGPCRGSYADPTQEEFSHFEIQDDIESDAACAEACALADVSEKKVLSFSRRVHLNRCYCQFQKDTANFEADYEGSGVGAVVEGTDSRFSCYGHYQSGNQIIDSTTKTLVNDGRTRFELKGEGPCRDSTYMQFPYFQIVNQLTAGSDDACLQNCQAVFSDIVGIARHQISGECLCHYDAATTLPDLGSSITRIRAKDGTGEVFAGWLPDYSCVGRVEGRSGFDFIGSGGCSDNSNSWFPHVRVSDNSHSDADCAKLCLEDLPQILIGFTRNQEDLSCYCAYSTGSTLPEPYNSNTVNYPRLWENQGGTGSVVASKVDANALGYSCYALDDTSQVKDCPDNSNLATELDTTGLRILESWCDCNNGNGKDVYDVGDSCSCSRPYRWCTNPGDEYFYLDCDGDGTTDSLCTSDDGDITTLQSNNACNEQEGDDVSATCSSKVDGCLKPASWCNGDYLFLDCDGDGAKDSVCESGGIYNVALSSNNCDDDNSVDIDDVCPAVNACVREDTWCTGPGNRYFFIDCDDDGSLDSLCQTSNTTYLLQLSRGGCAETSADDTTLSNLCPASGCVRPETWCGHPGSQYYYVDCDGDGVMDSHCRDEEGYTYTILSGSSGGGCKRTRDKCPAADFCPHRNDWCNHAGSHFYWTDPNGTYGDNESRCILGVGSQWQDTTCYRDLTDVRQEREYILSKS